MARATAAGSLGMLVTLLCSPSWETGQAIISLAERLGARSPLLLLNWTTPEDMKNLLYLVGFDLVHRRGHILLPRRVSGLTPLANRYLSHLSGLRWLCLTSWVVARPVRMEPEPPRASPPSHG